MAAQQPAAEKPVLLSEEDVARAVAAFTAHDPERRGIRPCDLGPVFRAMGEGVTDTEVFEMMCEANVTSEEAGTLPFDEVLRLLLERRQRIAAGVSASDLAMVRVLRSSAARCGWGAAFHRTRLTHTCTRGRFFTQHRPLWRAVGTQRTRRATSTGTSSCSW